MVSWDKSMGAAFKVIAYSVIWWIIGIILIFIGFSMIGSGLLNTTSDFMAGKVPNFANVLIGLIVIAIGCILTISGFLASFMKVHTELIVEETDEYSIKALTEPIVEETDDSRTDKNIPSAKLNKYEKEFKSFEENIENIELKSDYADKWYNKGVELGELGRHDEAIKAYKKATGIKPDYADAWYNRACIYSVKGDKNGALITLKKAIEIDSSNKEEAKKEKDFENLWDDKDFKKLVD